MRGVSGGRLDLSHESNEDPHRPNLIVYTCILTVRSPGRIVLCYCPCTLVLRSGHTPHPHTTPITVLRTSHVRTCRGTYRLLFQRIFTQTVYNVGRVSYFPSVVSPGFLSSSLAFYWHSKKVSDPPPRPNWLTNGRTFRPHSVIYRPLRRQNSVMCQSEQERIPHPVSPTSDSIK